MRMKPTHPGEIIREECMKPLGMSVTAFAVHLGVSRKTLSAILNKRAGISPEMALRLAQALGTTPGFWLTMQTDWDLWQVEKSRKEWRAVRRLLPSSV